MKDIAEHYRMIPASQGGEDLEPSTASGFWVAEVDTAKGKEIVGCAGLGLRLVYIPLLRTN